jgi:hypothetical protein
VSGGDAAPGQHRYFTDGVHLYRLVCWLNRPVGPRLAELEDCRSLDCMIVTSDDLVRLPLRPVLVAAGA